MEQLRKENGDLKATVQINKTLINELLGNADQSLKELIEKRYWALEEQLVQVRHERDYARDECFIKE